MRTFADPAAGRLAGMVMTGLILFVAAASLYATILGYSRIPFAAARDGDFFAVFAKVHPTKHFPHVSLVVIALISLPFCFFSLGQLVSWLIQVQILLRFVWQCAAVILLRRYRPDIPQPFTMWLYPLPALLSLAAVALHLLHRTVGRHCLFVRLPRGLGHGLFRLRAAAPAGGVARGTTLRRAGPRGSDCRPGQPRRSWPGRWWFRQLRSSASRLAPSIAAAARARR